MVYLTFAWLNIPKYGPYRGVEEDAFYKDVVLVVFESVAPLISPIRGPEDGGHGHGLMVKFGQALKKIAYDYNVAVLLTNHVVADSDHSYTRPALGTNWSRILDNRIFLHDSEEDPTQKMMKLVKSIHLPLKDGVRIKITKSGLRDDS
ncbi:DNA repair protein RAD51 homolog 4-like [Dendronephthya gigantea]|uniref:DNA repair protein RAD51 homolog 4-like n=1 Tax=Dendronephthya gigantea TaxID=151771 RepID=UPI001069FA76|nr:DNA repair protein RAD51 homolog 4-like [Dendronephthya gigantea]